MNQKGVRNYTTWNYNTHLGKQFNLNELDTKLFGIFLGEQNA